MKKVSNKPFILIHVGHSRAGASWAQDNLFNSKKAGFAMVNRYTKEYKFIEAITNTSVLKFDVKKIRSDLESVYSKFRKKKLIPVLSAESLLGNPTTGARDIESITRNLYKMYPNAKIFMMIRNQPSLLRSMYLRYIHAGGIQSLEKFLLKKSRGGFHCFDINCYDFYDQYNLYSKIFGKNNILINPLELLISNPNLFLKRIFNFCNLKGYYNFNSKEKKNRSRDSLNFTYKKLINYLLYNGGDPYLLNPLIFRASFSKNLRVFFDKFYSREFNRKREDELEKKVKSIIKDYFYKSNKKLEKEINLSLHQFNYYK